MVKTIKVRLDSLGCPPAPKAVRRQARPGPRHLHPVSSGS